MSNINVGTIHWVIQILAKDNFTTTSGEHAIERILMYCESSDEQLHAASFAVQSLLDIVGKSTCILVPDTRSLSLALRLSEKFEITKDVAENLVLSTATHGFHGYFPRITERLLERPPTTGEVTLLIDHYISDRAVQSDHTEKKLSLLAHSYLSKDDAQAQIARLMEFHKKFHADRIDF